MADGESPSPFSMRLAGGIGDRKSYPLAKYRREGMRSREIQQVLESVFVEMDPALCGFAGVFVELCRTGDGFIVIETAAGSGNRLLRFRTKERDLAYSVLRRELDPPRTRIHRG